MPRPRTLTRKIKNPEQAVQALRLVAHGIQTITGTDERPSPLWKALSVLPGTDSDGWELAQDVALACAETCHVIADNVNNPPGLAMGVIGVWIGAIPEIKADVDEMKS